MEPTSGRRLGDCVAVDPIHEGPQLRIVHWHCLRDGRALRSERYHEEYVLTLIHAGACRLHSGGRSTVLDASCAVLHGPGVPYRTTHPFGCGDRGTNIAIRRDVFLALLERVAPRLAARHQARDRRLPLHIVACPPSGFLHHVLSVRRQRNGLPLDPEALEANTLALVAEVLRGLDRHQASAAARQGTQQDHHRAVDTVRGLLSRRGHEPLTLAQIAREASVSPYHLSRIFKTATGLPIHRYRTRLRLLTALDRIASGESRLDHLALDLGFNSHSHLTTAFRRELGVPPSTIRRFLQGPGLGAASSAG